ncbi:lipopolysaccharide biosynthesis protein [uncultured Roseibium sp.]|uniref:lipopolysaccharide biosynthesis protein n=1 Tax=uncultured Roseibium sp. TaxID=1936171 RepID=UPI00260865B3|nr:oligosaccharide flippase family protein [uncultured Roseibium sp.]
MQSILSASFFVSASGLMSMIAGFFCSIVIARLLGAEGTGLTALASWVAITGAIVAGRGIPAIILRYISRKKETPEDQTGLVTQLYRKYIRLVLIVCFSFLLYGLYDYFTIDINNAFVWAIAGLICLAYAQGHFVVAADHGLGHFHRTAQKTAIGCALQIPTTIAGAFFLGPAGAMLGYLARYVPQAVGLRDYRSKSGTADVEITDQMVRYGQSNWISVLLDTLVKTRVELLFIGYFFTVVEVGYFAAGVTFSSLILQLSLYLAAGLTPSFGKFFDDGATEQLKVSYDRSIRWLTLLLLPVSLGGAVIMPELIPLAYGSDFLPAIPVAYTLVLFSLPPALSSVPLSAMLAFEKDRKILYINGLAAFILITLNLIFTPMFGGLAAALIRGATGLATFLWLIYHCHTRLGLNINLNSLARTLVSGLACALCAYLVLAELGGLSGVLLAIPVAAVVYLIALRITKSIPGEELEIVGTALNTYTPTRFRALVKPVIAVLGATPRN